MVQPILHLKTAGRPRNFDPDAALRAARDEFWRKGYEQTSLDDLIAAMGISRSSFYACFTSKRATLAYALTLYTDEMITRLNAIIAAEPNPLLALRATMVAIADVNGGRSGCFLANCISEFGPQDREIDRIIQTHVSQIEALLSGLIRALEKPDPKGLSRVLIALVLGVISLRKSGLAPAEVLATLQAGMNTVL